MSETKRIYFAARFSRRYDLFIIARLINERYEGYSVNSRWLNGSHDAPEGLTDRDLTDEERRRFLTEDMEDIASADIFVAFTETEEAGYTSGGRHVEFGLAIAGELDLVLVGPVENIFYAGIEIEKRFDSIESLLLALKAKKI